MCGNTMTAIIRALMEAGPHVRVGCAAAAVQHRTPAPAASRVPAALLAVFALAPDLRRRMRRRRHLRPQPGGGKGA